MPEPNLTDKQAVKLRNLGTGKVAKFCECKPGTVRKWLREAYIPFNRSGRRAAWLLEFELAEERAGQADAKPSIAMTDAEKDKALKLRAERRLKEEQAEKARLERETLEGSLVAKDAIRNALGASGRAMRTQADTMRRECEQLVPSGQRDKFRAVFNGGWQRVLEAAAKLFDPLIE